jgi:HAD superfamily hydrolase (TIGR01509 family)
MLCAKCTVRPLVMALAFRHPRRCARLAETDTLQFPRAAMSESFLIKAVVFDLDGLMFNTEALYHQVGGELLRRRGKAFGPDLLDQIMGRRTTVALQMMIDWHELPDSVEALVAESTEIFSVILDTELAQMPGLSDLLEALEVAKIPKAVATSSSRTFTLRVLGKFDLARRFRFLLTAEDVTEGKPDPEIYRTAAARLGVEPQEMMVLEDSYNGCQAAIAAGAYAVAVPGGHSLSQDFSGANLIADSLADPRIYAALGL